MNMLSYHVYILKHIMTVVMLRLIHAFVLNFILSQIGFSRSSYF